MIKNEAEIRVAVQAIVVTVLALSGLWGCALVVLVLLLPWRPLFLVGNYLAQPLVDWRIRKARDRHEQGLAQIEQELDMFLNTPRGEAATRPTPRAAEMDLSAKPEKIKMPKPPEAFKPIDPNVLPMAKLSPTTSDVPAALGIPSIIADHVRNLPHGAFSNMDLEIERVNFNGETADAFVKFKSSHVKELAIRQRYVLRKSGGQWEVESRRPTNGSSMEPKYSIPILQPPASSTRVGLA